MLFAIDLRKELISANKVPLLFDVHLLIQTVKLLAPLHQLHVKRPYPMPQPPVLLLLLLLTLTTVKLLGSICLLLLALLKKSLVMRGTGSGAGFDGDIFNS